MYGHHLKSIFRIVVPGFLVLFTLFLKAQADSPEIHDSRLTIERFAKQPDIKTPIGIDVDRDGRVFVIQSNTHKPPEEYEGPETDFIRVLEDTSGDGRADDVHNFHEGLHHAMDLRIHRNGWVYVAERDRILRLKDTNNDGTADRKQDVINMKSPGDYPHNGLSGLAFDYTGNLYFGLGENLGEPYTLVGTDGTTLSGEGEGGSVYYCRADGTNLRRVATGFWNPWGMCVDVFGRVLATDNDPDESPPCRLIRVVPGGDYGYEFRYGRSGRHPFQAWNGGQPGTLPMLAGTSEAPGGPIVYESDAFPTEYRGQIIVPSWGDHRIERIQLNETKKGPVKKKRKTLVQGSYAFRPVSIATAPDGTIYFTDWVRRSYNLHGQGRIWHIKPADQPRRDRASDSKKALLEPDREIRERAARRLSSTESGRSYLREQLRTSERVRVRTTALQALANTDRPGIEWTTYVRGSHPVPLRKLAARLAVRQGVSPGQLFDDTLPIAVKSVLLRHLRLPAHRDRLLNNLDHDDPFVRTAAVKGLTDEGDRLLELDPSTFKSPRKRLGLLLALKRSGHEQAGERLTAFLNDPDPDVRFSAVKWVADRGMKQKKSQLENLLSEDNLTIHVYKAVLAALAYLEDGKTSNWMPPERLHRTLTNPDVRSHLRRIALQLIDPEYEKLTVEQLVNISKAEDPRLRLKAVRALQQHPDEKRFNVFARIANDPSRRTVERAEALLALAGRAPEYRKLLMDHATRENDALRDEALRGLVGVSLSEEQRTQLKQVADGATEDVRDAVARALGNERTPRPERTDVDAWLNSIAGEGNPDAGRRVFFHPKAGNCSRCHRYRGRGKQIGPDLTRIHRGTTRRDLLSSLLTPSSDVAPTYTPWRVRTEEGDVRVGLVVDDGVNRQTYVGPAGNTFTVFAKQFQSRTRLNRSIMPAGPVLNLTGNEVRDLVAFLLNSKNK